MYSDMYIVESQKEASFEPLSVTLCFIHYAMSTGLTVK